MHPSVPSFLISTLNQLRAFLIQRSAFNVQRSAFPAAFLCVLLISAVPLPAQTAKTRAALYTDANTALADTGATEITPEDIRVLAKDIIASSYVPLTDGAVPTGTVTDFSAGDLSPLFTTSEATTTTTPALSFALTDAAQNAVFSGPATGGAGAPAYRALVAADIPSLTLSKISDAGTMAAATAANYSTTAQIAAAYQPLAAVLTGTTASYTTTIDTRLANTSGTNTGDQTNISGNAATVTTNANLSGHVTSSGNTTSLGSFTVAQLNTAISDADVATGGGTASGTNTGDNAVNTTYSGLVTNATHTGDATGSGALTVVALNNTNLAALATGLLKNTTTTGVPSIAVAGTDYAAPATWGTLTGTTPALTFTAAPQNRTQTLEGNTTYTASGYTQGYILNIFLTGDSVLRTLAFPAWTWLEGAPDELGIGKKMQITLTCTGAAAGDVFATYGVEQ